MKLDSTFVAHYTFIAANGDQVFGTATGYVVFTSATTFDVHGNWIVDGGTGRFLNATGSGTATGEVDLGTGVAPHHQVGVISSVGSSMGQ